VRHDIDHRQRHVAESPRVADEEAGARLLAPNWLPHFATDEGGVLSEMSRFPQIATTTERVVPLGRSDQDASAVLGH
jgi:hypothetical protein